MYRRRSGGWVKHVDFMLLDILCLQLSFVLAYWVRNGFGNPYAVSYPHLTLPTILRV